MTTRKYPRTTHLPFSRFKTADDISGTAWPFLQDGEMVVTEKMDGENTTFYRDHLHARSMDSLHHPSRNFVKGVWGNIRWAIPEGRRIVCENVYAEHSVRYNNLPTYVFAFAVIDELDEEGRLTPGGTPTFLSWDDSVAVMEALSLTPVPLLYRGQGSLKKVEEIFRAQDHSKQEGVVVRDAASFPEAAFQEHVGKAVRLNHITTGTHWTRTWRPNGLASS